MKRGRRWDPASYKSSYLIFYEAIMTGRTWGYLALLLIAVPLIAHACLQDETFREIAEKPRNTTLQEAKFQEAQQIHESDRLFERVGFSLLAFGSLAVILWTLPGHVKRERNNRRELLCPACGYDCRATRVRCPECGNLLPSALANTPTPPRPKL
jgi:hypothetical protein